MVQPTRSGLNCTLSYADGAGTQRGFRVRVETVVHALVQVFAESAGRNRRVMYPHRMSSGQFTLVLLLNGQPERQALSSYLARYDALLLDPGATAPSPVSVSVPSRNFSRSGIPLTGIEWGARVGQVLFRPQVTFETAVEPLDADPDPPVSVVPSVAAVGDGAVQYFYPFSTQLAGDQAPAGSVLIPGVSSLPDPTDWGQ